MPKLRIMLGRFALQILAFHVLVCGLSHRELFAAVIWEYEMTDGTKTVSGRFTTDGEFADTQGVGSTIFTITDFDPAISIDSVLIDFRDPINTASSKWNQFTWSRDSQSVTELSRRFVRGMNEFNVASKIEISLGIHRFDPPGYVVDGDKDPAEFFFFDDPAAKTTFTPVPEVSGSAIVVSLLLTGWLCWRSQFKVNSLEQG